MPFIDSIKKMYQAMNQAMGGSFRHSGSLGGGGGFLTSLNGFTISLPGTDFDFEREAGDPQTNSAVMACVQWMARTFPEAPLQVEKRAGDGSYTALPDHPLTALIARPNQFYSGNLLWSATLTSWMVSGNAFWYKVRNAGGQVKELWYIPHFQMRPIWPADGSEYISYYRYTPDGRQYDIDIADVVHFRQGLDPRNPRMGISPLATVLREICTDNEAATYSASILRNMGVPGVIIKPNAEALEMTAEDAELVKKQFKTAFTRDKRGEPIILSADVSIEAPAFSPDKMLIDKIRDIPEERISAVLGIPAVVVGLGAGLQNSTYNNMSEAREMAYESAVIPTQRLFAADLNVQLLPDLSNRPDRERVCFDLSQVRVLQTDENELYTRVCLAYEKGVIKRSEARTAIHQPFEPEDEVYVTDVSTANQTAILDATPDPVPAQPFPVADAGQDTQNEQEEQ